MTPIQVVLLVLVDLTGKAFYLCPVHYRWEIVSVVGTSRYPTSGEVR